MRRPHPLRARLLHHPHHPRRRQRRAELPVVLQVVVPVDLPAAVAVPAADSCKRRSRSRRVVIR